MVTEDAVPPSRTLIDHAREIASTVLRRWAPVVDEENRFPTESVAALRDSGLLGYFVPRELGGQGGDVGTYCRIAEILGGECASTALIWAMHAHQVATLADHHSPAHRPYLREIADRAPLVASVTSEYGKGGDVLRADAPLRPTGGNLRVERRAPFVSYGAEAGFYLVTMRAGEDRPPADVRLVLVRPDDGAVTVTGQWDAMGLRATRTVPMAFDVVVEPHRIVGESFRPVALKTLVPLAQAGWSAAWLGAAKGALDSFVRQERERRSRGWDSDLFLTRLADVRMRLDLVESLLLRVAERMDELRATDAPMERYEDPTHNVLVNNLKIAASRLTFSVVDDLMGLAGLHRGYLRTDPSRLERVFRDLRAAAMTYGNDRLLIANGRLILVEGGTLSRIWNPTPRS